MYRRQIPPLWCTSDSSNSIRGKDGELHSKTVDATSLFDTADEVIRDWNRLWWWSSSSLIQIESGQDRWRVNQATVRKWRTARKRSS
jgi:hypothetical protein